MPIYKQTTELTKIADFLTAAAGHDIQWVYFGNNQVFTVWNTYDGTLPATYSANGSVLSDYRVYGSAGGVGDKTAQLFDKNAKDTSNGYVQYRYINSDGELNSSQNLAWSVSEYIPCTPNQEYSLKTTAGAAAPSICWYDNNYNYLSGIAYNRQAQLSIVSPTNAAYLRFSVYQYVIGVNSLVPSSAGTGDIPFGYEVDMSVSDGNTATTTPIYIGSDPLGEDEYVSFKEQKVYRRTANKFDKNAVTDGAYFREDGSITKTIGTGGWSISEYIECEEGKTYTAYGMQKGGTGTYHCVYDANKNFIRSIPMTANINSTITIGQDEKYVRLSVRSINNEINDAMFYEGTTAPSTYIPYLQPTDPPVPLPALPTVNGVTITDYAGQSTPPSRFYAKYRKEHF